MNSTLAAGRGGGIYATGGQLELMRCWFDTNEATVDGGAVYSAANSAATIDSCVFKSNYAMSGGGAIYQNHPNPFNPTTTISFALPERSRVMLDIYDVEGRLVRRLVDEVRGEGLNEAVWDGKDQRGREVGSGVYFYRLRAGNETLTRKMTVLR